MRILFLHPYGKKLAGWNHRLQRQMDLMEKKCDFRLVASRKAVAMSDGVDNIWFKNVSDTIKEFKPDVVYVNGFMLAYHVLKMHKKIVFDMGSWVARNILMDNRVTYKDMRRMKKEELKGKANWACRSIFYQMEEEVIEKVNAIVIWESEEAQFVKKMYGVGDKLHEISMMFCELPKPIPWKEKKDRVIAIAAKWGGRGKNGRLLNNMNLKLGKDSKYYIHSVGHGGNWERYVPHGELMDMLNESKVLFCPYLCGGIGVLYEGLKLGCNVVAGDWYPCLTHINPELVIGSEKKLQGRCIDMLKKAMLKCYPPKKELPTEEEQVTKILDVCQQVADR